MQGIKTLIGRYSVFFIKMTLVVFVALSIGCAGQAPDVSYQQQYDFSSLETYRFLSRQELAKFNPLTSDLTRNRIEIALEHEMADKGYAYAEKGRAADILIAYHITGHGQKALKPIVGVRYQCSNCRGERAKGAGNPKKSDQGSLIIEMLDSVGRRPIWRGMVPGQLGPGMSASEKSKKIKEVVATILAQFPPTTTAP